MVDTALTPANNVGAAEPAKAAAAEKKENNVGLSSPPSCSPC